MDREPDEVQLIGFYGVYKEAFKIIFWCPKIFTQITLAFILPLSFIVLADLPIPELIFTRFPYNKEAIRTSSPMLNGVSDWVSSDWITLLVFKAGYLLLVLVLSLSSTSAVVYTIACIYTAKDLTFAKVLSVVAMVWQNLLITYLWEYSFVFASSAYITLLLNGAVLFVEIVMWSPKIAEALSRDNITSEQVVSKFVYICNALHFFGPVCFNFFWHLASVVSVLEDMCGFEAVFKSEELIKGKMEVVGAIYISTKLSKFVIESVFTSYVLYAPFPAWMSYWVGCFLVSTILILLELVMQTVVYFICKSYHHDTIICPTRKKLDHVPLKGRYTQLEQFDI